MATLPEWQRIDRVIPNKPWGNGSAGDYSSATIPTLTKDSCSGSATSTTLTTAGSTFANGDILLIHQTRGTGVGQWEINKVDSGGGSTSLTLNKALNYTYTDSGASQAQAIKIPQYTNVTVETGTWTVPSWDGNTGGILVFACKGDLTVTGTIAANGGTATSATGASGCGFAGGSSHTDAAAGYQGEGTPGIGVKSGSPNGNGGGGGGGGGVGAGGSNGASDGSPNGAVSGTADLLEITFGGGGGGGGNYSGYQIGGGAGSGAGIIMIFVKNVASVNSITLTGGNGYVLDPGGSDDVSGGNGAGGSCLVACATATLGTTKITASGGSNGHGWNGSVGRIAVHHSGAITGTTSPTFEDIEDITLKEKTSGMFLVF